MPSMLALSVASLLLAGGQAPAIDATHFADRPLAERRSVIAALDRTSRTQPVTDDTLALIEVAIVDPDQSVRSTAASILSGVVYPMPMSPSKEQASTAALQRRPVLQQRCLNALSGDDWVVRGVCVTALFRGVQPMQGETQAALLALYDRERAGPIRGAIVDGFAKGDAQNSDVQRLMVAALDDEDGSVKSAAARGIARMHPPDALPKLVAAIQAPVGHAPQMDVYKRRSLIEALVSYGAQAKPYLGLLEAFVLNESNPTEIEFLHSAIDRIKNSK